MSLFAELKRRNVLRAGALYAAGAWLLVQVVTQVGPVFDLPSATQRWIVIAAVIGFPFAMALSWFYEWTPEGFKRESEVEVPETIRYPMFDARRYPLLMKTLAAQGIQPPLPQVESYACKPAAAAR